MKSLPLIMTCYFIISLSLTTCKYTQFAKQNIKVEIKKEVNLKDSKIDELPECFFDNQWVHRYKEDKDGFQFFKPEVKVKLYKLYSNQLFFNNDRTCRYKWLAPNDAHKMKDATWTYIPDGLYILENEIDIIDVYRIHSISDSLLLMKKEGVLFNNIYGKWKLVETRRRKKSDLAYVIDIKGNEVIISKAGKVLHSYDMFQSLKRIGEPIALNFDVAISKLYPWITSGQYGIINDT